MDIHELVIQEVKRKIKKYELTNIEPLLAQDYNSGIPDHVADVICALDMFFIIQKPVEFLAELRHISKNNGILIIDDGHQKRIETKSSIQESMLWLIMEESKDHLKCKPIWAENPA